MPLILPPFELGDLPVIGAGGVLTRLSGNVSTTRKFLRQTGNGSVSAAPVWDTILDADVPALSSVTAGTAVASKALIVDSSKDISSLRNVSLTGKINFFNSSITPTDVSGIPVLTINYGGTTNYHELYDRYFSHYVTADFGGYREFCASSNASHYLGFFMNRTGGTVGAYAATPAFANLGQYVFRGHDGTGITGDVAALRAVSTESGTYSSSVRGAKLSLYSTATGTTTLSESVACHGPRVGINLAGGAPGVTLDVNGDTIRLRTSRTPASASATGNAGEICWDSTYLYLCVASNTWRRIAHATW